MDTAIIIPMYGKHELTDALLGDIAEEILRDNYFVIVIDNKGDYENANADLIHCPANNLGWLKSVNKGLSLAYAMGFERYVFMDNDVRLSYQFLNFMHKDYEPGGLLAPIYDDVWEHQRIVGEKVAAHSFVPPTVSRVRRNQKFVDGTCQMLDEDLYDAARESADGNWLDERYFAQHGWGADFDLGIRLKNLGREISITERAYLNHLRGTTNNSIKPNYEGDAGGEMHSGMRAKYGDDWGSLI